MSKDTMDYIFDISETKKERSKKVDYKNTGKKIKATDQLLDQVKLGQIVWYEVRKHRTVIISTYAAVITALYIINGLPIAIHNVFGR